MSIVYEEKPSDSPYVETIMHGRTLSDDSPVCPAECRWHMVFVRKDGEEVRVVFVGAWTTAGFTYYAAGAAIFWVKFKLGTFMPHLPASNLLGAETILPEAASRSFWLKGSAWLFPDYENAETFVETLVRNATCWFVTRSWWPCYEASRKCCQPARCGIGSCGPPA